MTELKIEQVLKLAVQHHQAGRLGEAEQIYRQILSRDPRHVPSLHLLGVIADQVGQHDKAVELIRQSIALNPNFPGAYYNLGNALKNKGSADEAIEAYRQAIAVKPDHIQAHINLAVALQEKGKLDEAIAGYRRAIALRPDHAEAYSMLGIALGYQGRLDDALAVHRQALALRPDSAEGYSNIGMVLSQQRQMDEAIAAHRRANSLNPDLPEIHRNLAVALLVNGDLAEGWEEFEWRWQCKDFPSPQRKFSQPQWDGSPLGGRTILLHAEQGYGDTLQFIRYVPMVLQRGGQAIVECQGPLNRLLQMMEAGCRIVAHGTELPGFDVHCPLLSLPRALGTKTLESIPRAVPYLSADTRDAEKWRQRMEAKSGLKVGLAWAGHPNKYRNERNRLMTLAEFAPLAQVRGVQFYSLQKGRAKQAAPAGMELIDWTEELNDFADTAGLVANLDLVIAVDTAVVHLAGAMGKAVWTLLPFVPDWRWLLGREDCPWYPTMRLFRQPSVGDWESVTRQAAEALAAMARR